jgi:hypothetical protein
MFIRDSVLREQIDDEQKQARTRSQTTFLKMVKEALFDRFEQLDGVSWYQGLEYNDEFYTFKTVSDDRWLEDTLAYKYVGYGEYKTFYGGFTERDILEAASEFFGEFSEATLYDLFGNGTVTIERGPQGPLVLICDGEFTPIAGLEVYHL